MNPASLMQFLNAKKQFEQSHPKFAAFIKNLPVQGLTPGSIIDVQITRPDGTTVTANMRVQESDLKLLEGLKDLASMK